VEVAFIHGFVLALGLILPLGIQNVFIFSQGASHGRLIKALPAVLAAAVSDTLLILLAVQGVSLVILTFYWLRVVLVVVGAVFIAYMGWLTWNSSANIELSEDTALWSVKRQVIFALTVSLFNPHAILDTIGVIGTSSLAYGGSEKSAFVAACIAVSWGWFIFLAAAGRTLRVLDSGGMVLRLMNKASAVIMWLSGLYMLYSLNHTF
jgi:L-lysine exporter family protein LysE/ArgO